MEQVETMNDSSKTTTDTNKITLRSILRPPSTAPPPAAVQATKTAPPFANRHHQTTSVEDGPPPNINIFRNHLLTEFIISDSSAHSDDGDDDDMKRSAQICMPKHMKDEDSLNDSCHSEEEWAAKTLGSRSKMKQQQRRYSSSEKQSHAWNPFASPPPAFATSNLRNSVNSDDGSGISGEGSSCCSGSASNKKTIKRYSVRDRQELEMESILQALEDLQHNFVENNNSNERSISANNFTKMGAVTKEFTIRQYPNGDLFSGNVNVETGDLVYGRMTYALDMEVYEGPFWKGKRHGESAVCMKMDGAAKFLGR